MFESLLIFGASGASSGEALDSSDDIISIFNTIAAAGDGFDPTDLVADEECPIAFDVRTVLPNWIVEEHENGNSDLVNFFQTYYNWLYCPARSGLYTDSVIDLQDIDNMNSITVQAFNDSFIPQIDFGGNINQLKQFLKNYRRDILQKKGTPEGIALFFTKAFPEVTEVTVTPTNLGVTVVIKGDGSRQLSEYENAYRQIMHVVGTQFTLESPSLFGSENREAQDDSDIDSRLSGFTGFDGTTASAYEVPVIGNYYVYNLGDTGTIDSSSGCSGSVHARAIAGNISDLPTFTHPNTSIGPVGVSFADINIYEFLYMDYDTSTNKGITSCK